MSQTQPVPTRVPRPPDPLIDCVRQVRETLSVEAGNDRKRLVQALEALRTAYAARVVPKPHPQQREGA